jgi:diguanylate cyclase (GGDEF)-like protein
MPLIEDRVLLEEPLNRADSPHVPGPAHLWNIVVLVVLFAGMTMSTIGAVAWHGYVQSQARNTFATNAASVSAAVSTALRRDVDFVATERAGVVSIPDLTNRELAVWYTSIDVKNRFPGGVGFAFVQRVLATQLNAFGAEVVADPPVNEPVSAPYSVFPAGARSQYCLQRFGIATSSAAKVIPTTFDFCSPTIPPGNSRSPIPDLLDEATTNGRTTVLAAGKIAKTGGISDLFVLFSPVYESAGTPSSVSARQTDVRGWIVATFSGGALLGSNIVTDHRLSVSILFDEPGSGSTPITTSGKAPSGTFFTRSLRFNAGGSWVVRVVGSARSSATAQALGVGLLGAGVTLLLFLLLGLLTRSRAMALRMVDESTSQLRHQALYDSLTDLPNRALILDRAEQMIVRATRQPLLVGALFIDLDNFKVVNDTFGHEVGDELLRAVGFRLSEELRASDSVGRLGGDEFVVLAEGELGGIGPELVAEKLLASFAEPFILERSRVGPLHIGVSIGVALGPRDGAAQLLRDADVALYEAKARGKNGYVVFRPDMGMALNDRLGLEPDPRRAPSEGDSRPRYQATFELEDTAIGDGTAAAAPSGPRSPSI